MTIDREHLRQLASEATPGPWKLFPWKPNGKAAVVAFDTIPPCLDAGAVFYDKIDVYGPRVNSTAAYIAAVHPQAVLALLDELDAKDAEIASLKAENERIRAETIEECAVAAGRAAWLHLGDDAYSTGMDKGAREQVHACVNAIRALSQPTKTENRPCTG